MPNPSRPARLEARLPPELHLALKRAAQIEGRTLTDFVVAAASAAARKTLERADVLRLAGDSAALVASLLADPPPPTAALIRAGLHHRDLIGPLD